MTRVNYGNRHDLADLTPRSDLVSFVLLGSGMNHLARPLVALSLLAAASTPALADDGQTVTTQADTLVVVTPNAPVVVQQGGPGVAAPAPAPAPMVAPAMAAPQNESWENVSHINGQVVEVGERGKYLKKTFKTNISTNPIGWLAGFYGVSLSHAVHPNVAIRGDANIFHNLFSEGTSGYEVGATLPIYFKRVYSGPFIEPGLVIRHTEETYDDYYYDSSGSYTEGDTLVGPQVLFGWHWTFDSGLNAAMAFGMAKNLGTRQMDEYGYSSDPDLEPTGYFRIGYAWQ